MERKLFSGTRSGLMIALAVVAPLWCAGAAAADPGLPPAIRAIMDAPRYSGAIWGLQAIELPSGATATAYGPDALFFTGSVRKLFSVGLALNALGADHRFETPVYRLGDVTADGTLQGDLVLLASGDLTLGGRTIADGKIAFTNFDHTESNSLGSAILTQTDPLSGLDFLARQVAQSGIKAVAGDVIIDDRLFDHFRVPNGNVLITPIIVNDNLIDVTILPTEARQAAKVDWRPKTAAFMVRSEVKTVAAGEPIEIALEISPDDSKVGVVKGQIPVGYKASLPGVATLVRTFPIADPSSFARTAFIEALGRAGVAVTAAATRGNPSAKLPSNGSYAKFTRVARLVSPPYAEYAKLILKVSHNLGANLSLALLGLTKGARTVETALAVERNMLVGEYGLSPDGFDFPTNGSGSPDSRATPSAVTGLLAAMRKTKASEAYFDALPALGVDGSLATVGIDPPNPTIAPAVGRVFAKTGTTIADGTLKAQVFAGYIKSKAGKLLAYVVYVNNVTPIGSIADVIEVFGDEGEISAILYDLN
ncbi:D-alanyl-D-alanine carboxypeptidase/D-alanyl-D-alanine-endopeptidase [Mesorhizobium sp. LjRoot246]|uniref:D-alanyl-D-alanine carboxypeptidase/D-alanyl-D-alanine-endopeptidase n=1 Tax=Mesorhizobium sp. LjRoot246 TaxID=3342294 RepID=UPI003ED0B27D